MAVDTTSRGTGASVNGRAPAPAPPARDLRALGELGGYAAVAIGFAVVLWLNVRRVDAYYLDEWFYTHGAEYIFGNFPAGLFESIPGWNRGLQRAYPALLGLFWGPLGTSTAYTLSHALNVLMLASSVVPAALVARRVIDHWALRVIAVALAVVLPWASVGMHLLTESLAFPLFLWTLVAILRAAEDAALGRTLVALAGVGGLVLTRISLAPMIGVLFAAVLAAELQRRREPGWLRAALRRRALLLVIAAGAAAGAVAVLLKPSLLGWYGTVDVDFLIESLVGERALTTRTTALTYSRSLLVGGLVLPLVLGGAVALAAAAGRLGAARVAPAVAALVTFAALLLVVAIPTSASAIEERYVFYVYAPLALLAPAAVEHARRLWAWAIPAGAAALWALISGVAMPAADAGHFFAAPAGGFWSRVMYHRLRRWEEDLLGLEPRGWVLIAIGLALLVALLLAARWRPRPVAALLAGALAVCALYQVVILNYSMRQELYGTRDVVGGIALSPARDADRETWLDGALPHGESAAVMPGVSGEGGPSGGTETLQFWNRELDATVALGFVGAPVPAPPGHSVIDTELGPDGLLRWKGARPGLVATHADDPRVQFPGREVGRSPQSRYVLMRVRPGPALWTSSGVEPDGALVEGRPAELVLNRAQTRARNIRLRLERIAGAPGPVRWRLAHAGRAVASGTIAAGAIRTARVRIPRCAGRCEPVRWRLTTSGPPVALALPVYGAPGPARPVTIRLAAVAIG